MGEPVTVIENESSRENYFRYETNRSFTGMGHEKYLADETVYGERPPDELAKVLFATGKVDEVHVYGQMVTIKVSDGKNSSGLQSVIENHYIHYRPGVDVPTAESFTE